MSHLPVLVIAIPLVFAFALPLIFLLGPRVRRPVVFSMGWAYFAVVLIMAGGWRDAGAQPLVYPIGGWGPEIGIALRLDALSAVFSALLALGMLLVILYSQEYVDQGESKYYVLLFIVAAGMMGTVLTADFFNLYVFIEMTAISSFPLVALSRKGKAVFAAFYYMVFTMVSSALILLAIILIYGATGSLNMAEVAAGFGDLSTTLRSAIIGSLVVGLGVKIALIPFHSWLPPAHAEAVSPVSALLSGVLLKTGVYMMIRLLPMLAAGGADALMVRRVLLAIGSLTIIGGHVLALGQDNMKRILACSSVAHMGYIALGLGIGGPLGVGGALFHSLNHLLMKSGAFFAVGRMVHGDFQLELLRGKGHAAPLPGWAFAACTGALIGLPPFGSFASKLMIVMGALAAGMIPAALLLPIGGVLSAMYYGRAYRVIYDAAATFEEGEDLAVPLQTAGVLGFTAVGCVVTLVASPVLWRFFLAVAGGIIG